MKRSLRSWLWHVGVHQEVDEEIAFHIEMRTRELIERGVEPKTAREIVLARLGDVRRLKRTCVDLGRKREREMRLTQWLGEFSDDVRFALRQLMAAPAFTFVAATTLALGIGANSAIFALADSILLRPLPFREPDRLVLISEQFGDLQGCCAVVAPLNLRDWNDRSRTFQGMAGMSYGGALRTIAGVDGTVEQVTGYRVTAQFFQVLGVEPIAGRVFVPNDVTSRAEVVVLNEAFWRARFDGDRTMIGRDIPIDGRPYTVIGIVPEQSQGLAPSSFWTPYVSPPGLDERALHFMRVVGRLKPGVTAAAARSDLAAIAADLAREYPATNKGRTIRLDPLRDWVIRSEVRLTSALLLGVVGFVLLMCCANIANLLLARTAARARELALRSALGAGRRRIVAQILTESLVLAAIGGLLGLAVGAAILRVAPAAIPQGFLPAAISLAFDGRVVAFCALSALAVGILFGLAPAFQATGQSLVQALGSESRGATHRSGRLRSLLVVGEVATAVLLLCGAGLLLRTLIAVERVDAGYDADGVLTVQVNLSGGVPGSRYPTVESMRRFYETVEQEIARAPGVKSVAWGRALPLDHEFIHETTFQIVGDPPRELNSRPTADVQVISPAFFQTLGIPMVRGRRFTVTDSAESVPVCIVNEAFVRQYLKGRDPLGVRVAIARAGDLRSRVPVEREIVGVVRQVKGRPVETEEPLHVYVPLGQDVMTVNASLVVQPSTGGADALAPIIRAAIARVDSNVPAVRVRTMDDIAWQATSRQRFRAVLVVIFGALALVLAMIGVFGVLAYSVQQRTREFGVRIALGANARSVLGLVLGGAARVIGAGVAVGLALAFAFAQAVSTFLFGVPPRDPISFVAATVVLTVTATVAAAAPAIRAARVDPVEAFRSE
jgi:putative ABC transport system permease protein